MRLMGKAEIAEMQPYELVITIMIAELAVLPMENIGAPLINGLVAISTLILMQVFISYMSLKSERARGFISGKPSILINKGQINEKELKKLRINLNDLVEQLRSKDYPILDDVEYAILETNGTLSVIPKPNKRNVTVNDLQLSVSHEGLPTTLIIDGHINHRNLKILNLNLEWLKKQLTIKNIKDPKEILFCYVDANQEVYIHKKAQQ
jgi:uncharacterized membrane protein YcaP (DUF421 family)